MTISTSRHKFGLLLVQLVMALALGAGFSSCKTAKEVPYFQYNTQRDSLGGSLYDIHIKPKDEISIKVVNPDGTMSPFNMVIASRYSQAVKLAEGSTVRGTVRPYLVDLDGTVNMPIIGKVKVAGLTLRQAERRIMEAMTPYLSEQKENHPTVVVNMLTYKISVLGEVASPGVYTFGDEKVNLLQALSRAGDLTIHGKRKNVTLIRENADGRKEFHEFDLDDRAIVTSPYFYLEQDDIVYVEPNGVQKQNAAVSTPTRYWLRAIAITLSMVALLRRIL